RARFGRTGARWPVVLSFPHRRSSDLGVAAGVGHPPNDCVGADGELARRIVGEGKTRTVVGDSRAAQIHSRRETLVRIGVDGEIVGRKNRWVESSQVEHSFGAFRLGTT